MIIQYNSIDILFAYKAIEEALEQKIKKIHEATSDSNSSDSDSSEELNMNIKRKFLKPQIDVIKEQGNDETKSSFSHKSNTFTK